MAEEKTPLLRNNSNDGNSYYFLNNDNQGRAEVEELPAGSRGDEFEPRMLNGRRASEITSRTPKEEPSFFSKLFGGNKEGGSSPRHDHSIPSLVKQRKAPIKVEPKVFFANERTFLAWMHISIILAGASIAILAFSDNSSSTAAQLYGIIMLPVAVSFIIYAMYQYVRRAYMIRNKHPGPYEDTVGPTVLGIMLMISIVCQFATKLYSMSM